MDVGQLSALGLERCPRSTWNGASWVVHAAPVRWVDNREGRFEGNRDQRKQRQRDYKATFALLQSRRVKGSPAAPPPTPHRRRGTGAPGAAATAAANGPLRIFAEGASWFDYLVPFIGSGLVTRLEDRRSTR